MFGQIYGRMDGFQFHLVRLKARPRYTELYPNFISIPFSTIKSRPVFYPSVGLVLFQFHLVRLKVCVRAGEQSSPEFQFHLVRLKAVQLLSISVKPHIFQFHLVRLKVLSY